MLLRQVDRRIGLSEAVAAALHDPRDPDRISHTMRELVAQRLYGLCSGYEDLNDHDRLRHDPLLQTAVGKATELASSPTLSRLETRVIRADIVALSRVLVEQFIAAHPKPPEELILDIDASDVPLHGNQELAEFHGYYGSYCYLPLYVFCGKAMLACLLRRSRIDGAQHVAAVIKLLVAHLRQVWPKARIIVRGDSGFCRQPLIRWCERHGVYYAIGVARNLRLHSQVAGWERLMKERYTDAVRRLGLHADAAPAGNRPGRHRTGQGLCRHHPGETAQDRRLHPTQHPAHPHPAGFTSPHARHLTLQPQEPWPLKPPASAAPAR